MDNRVETLISAIGQLRDYYHGKEDVKEVQNALDSILGSNTKCTQVVYTTNTDKLPFGCVAMPVMNVGEVNDFMITGSDMQIHSYEVELDSKLFDYGLTDEQVAQILLFNTYHLTNGFAPCRCVREAVDDFFTESGNQLIIRSSVQYQAILKLGLTDALVKVSSCFSLPDDVLSDPFLESLDMYNFKETLDKVYQQIPGCENEVSRMPKLSLLNWCLRLYDDVEKERIPALHMMAKAKSITASVLYINKFNAVINALNHIDTDNYVNEAVAEVFLEAKRKGGLLASLKYNGLRDIENDLYEFQIRAKNAETESEVMYALKQINARLAILDDYIRENPEDPELDRWVSVKMEYMEIRDVLAKKKLHKRAYGIFVDYDALDRLDEEE